METRSCALCERPTPGPVTLTFHRERRGEEVALAIGLCDACGDRMEKHLKRAIPKRLMQITPVAGL